MAVPTAFTAPDESPTLVSLLRWWAGSHAGVRALSFLHDGEVESECLNYGDLVRRAENLGAELESRGFRGERVLLLFPSGLECVVAFLGCLFAGAVAVPVPVPRALHQLSRLGPIIHQARPRLALTTSTLLDRVRPLLAEGGLDSMAWVATDDPAIGGVGGCEAEVTADTVAMLQYTSGSTSHPKGVMVTHGNLMANHRRVRQAIAQSSQTPLVSWLPLFHDMGLIGNVLQALFLGSECVLMPPEAVLVKPGRWLQAISRHRGCTSGGPNFIYDHCVRKVTAAERATLDLSAWDVAFVGAEPVRAATLERFARTFEDCGFRREAFYPCYGLAEATLFVSGGFKRAGFVAADFNAREMESGRAVPAGGESATRRLVSCGQAWQEERIVIMDADLAVPCEPGRIGEIWVSGPNVTPGYWNEPDVTERTFRARLGDGGGEGFLRTGDLGFFHDGRLFIAGRLKDLVIVAGRNHHPGDIEESIEDCHPALRAGGCAVFTVEGDERERLVVAAELERGHRGADRDIITRAVRQAVAERHDLTVDVIVWLRPAGLPKTSSGKVRRQTCRAEFLAGRLKTWEECE